MYNKRKISGPRPLIPGTNLATYPVDSTLLDPTGYNGLSRVFHNEGTDYVDCGRPAFLGNLRPSVDEFTILFSFKPVNASAGTLMSLMYNPSNQRFAVETTATNQLKVWVGGAQTTFSGATYSSTNWNLAVLKYTTTQVKLFLNGVVASNIGVVGPGQHAEPLLLFGDFTGTSFNYNGDGGFIDFYSGVGDIDSPSTAELTLLDTYDFTRADLWDGGSSGTSVNGNAFTITDGTPEGTLAYSAVPINMLPSFTNVNTVIKKQVFHNEGLDYLNCGRPPFLSSIVPGVDEYTVKCSFSTTSETAGYIFGLGITGATSERQLGIRINSGTGDNKICVSVGGQFAISESMPDVTDGYIHEVMLKASTSIVKVYYDNTLILTTTTGTHETTENMYIGLLNLYGFNFVGDVSYLSFHSGIGDIDSPSLEGTTFLDIYDFTNPNSMKEATATFVSAKGNIGTFTDGTPTTAFNYAFIPVDKLPPSYTSDYVLTSVGNFDNAGTPSTTDKVILSNPDIDLNSDFEIEIAFKQDGSDPVEYTRLLCGNATSAYSGRALWIERDGSTAGYSLRMYYLNGSSVSFSTITNLIDDQWHMLKLKRVGNIITVYVDGVVDQTETITGELKVPKELGIGGYDSRTMKGQIAYFRYNDQIKYLFNEGSGTTIYNRFSNLYNAELTDGSPTTFWSVKDAVPSNMR